MAIIPQANLFSWTDFNGLGDLERLRLVLEYLPDEALVSKWEDERKNGRNDHPVRAVWNSFLAGIVFQHVSIESLRRELSRNAQLRWMCGFEEDQVPAAAVYTRFMKKLIRDQAMLTEIFEQMVSECYDLFPAFGEDLVIDSKPLASFARKKGQATDGRADSDADHSKKSYQGIGSDGKPWKKLVKWFGYKLHLILDADTELPVAYQVTRASASDITTAHEMIDNLEKKDSRILACAENVMADKGYDDEKLLVRVWDDHQIKPVIDIRNLWKDKDKTRLLGEYANVSYDNRGTLYCYDPGTGKQRPMVNGGFDKDREALKKLCPAQAYGLSCEGARDCPVAHGFRLKMDQDRRRFTPIARDSYKWKRLYNKRSAIERVNSRLDHQLGFERHTIRGKKKMEVRCGLALCLLLAMALGHVQENHPEKIRCLVS